VKLVKHFYCASTSVVPYRRFVQSLDFFANYFKVKGNLQIDIKMNYKGTTMVKDGED